jgi:hypothetical protein
MDVQPFPIPDGPTGNPLEPIVELYYQSQGYITSNGKWFWAFEEGKQRGYQDIDVLAIRGKETIIVSVTTNLDDKFGSGREDLLNRFFERAERYLGEAYGWLTADGRQLRRVVVHFDKRTPQRIKDVLQAERIEVLSGQEVVDGILEYLGHNPELKMVDPVLRLLYFLKFTYQGELCKKDKS